MTLNIQAPEQSQNPEQQQQTEQPKNEYVSKGDFDKLHNTFSEFTDIVTNHFIKPDGMRQQSASQDKPKESAETNLVSSEDVEAYGFEPKQVQFINSIAQKVAAATAEKVSKSTFTQATIETVSKSKLQEYDNRAYSSFPDLKNKNSDMYKITSQLMQEQRMIEPNADTRPDFLYSKALEASEKIKRISNASSQENNAPRRFDRFSVEVTGGSGGIRRQQNDEKISPERQQLRGLLK